MPRQTITYQRLTGGEIVEAKMECYEFTAAETHRLQEESRLFRRAKKVCRDQEISYEGWLFCDVGGYWFYGQLGTKVESVSPDEPVYVDLDAVFNQVERDLADTRYLKSLLQT